MTSEIAIITRDARGAVLGFSAGAQRLLGYSQDEVLGSVLPGIIDLGELAAPRDEHEIWTAPAESVTKSGARVHVLWTRSPVYDAEGSVVAFAEVLRPASEADMRKARDAPESRPALRADREARETEQLRRIVETAPGVYISYRADKDGSLTCPFVAPAVEDIYGYTPAQLALDAAPIWATLHPDDRERVIPATEQCLAELRPFRGEYRVRHPKRGEVWVESHSQPVHEPDGTVGWYGFVRDITERKRAEESLREAQAQLVAALEAGGMGLWIWDVPRDALHVDDLLLKLLGRRREELGGTSRDALAFVHDQDRPQVEAALDALAREVTELDFEYRVPLADGGTKWLAVRGRSERDEQGRIVRVTALHSDVTLQKQVAEVQLRAQKLEALGTLAGGIAHDFNNILQVIVGNTALVLRSLSSDHTLRGFLEAIDVATTRARNLVQRILAFSRPEEQPPTVIRLSEGVAEALKLVRATMSPTLELCTELDASTLRVAAGATQIHQLVANLVTNAVHAIGEGAGTIRVRLTAVAHDGQQQGSLRELPESTYALLQVSDDGCGMSPATRERIFDPFFTTKPVGQGTGLGLSVVHGIITSLGGAVTVTSEPGRGTTFSLYFPAAPEPRAEPAHGPGGGAIAAGERILFVDDEQMLVTLSTTILEMLGYEAQGHTDPREALARFSAAPMRFDAVITDVSMPEQSGFQLAERLLAVRSDIPIIMMSGYVGPEETARALRLGVRELLLKPVAIEELSRVLQRVLSARKR